MDQGELVTKGQALLEVLDKTELKPRAAMWVYTPDTDSWRLWIVPAQGVTDKREFYRRVAECIHAEPQGLSGFDLGSVEMTADSHRAIQALAKTFRVEGRSDVRLSKNMLDGFYLPEGILLRMAL